MWGHGVIVVGLPCQIYGPPMVEGSPLRIIITSDVKEGGGESWWYDWEKFWEVIDEITSPYS
jgi:hypothetical protein